MFNLTMLFFFVELEVSSLCQPMQIGDKLPGKPNLRQTEYPMPWNPERLVKFAIIVCEIAIFRNAEELKVVSRKVMWRGCLGCPH